MPAIPHTIKALRSNPINDQPAKLEVVSIPFGSRQDILNLAPDDVISKTIAVALNPTDKDALSVPCTLSYEHSTVVGCDSSSVVLAVGPAVKHIQVGDRVASFVFGTYDEYNGAFAEAVKSNRKTTWVLPDKGETGGHVVTTLEVSEANEARRPEVATTFHLAYETVKPDFWYFGVHHTKDGSQLSLDWILNELPALLEG
ncbi:hypothetical protein BDY24DRAFT_415911 [Mrakia frigida]|uniref:uncharacterized protein n=1 Tax=Mrakia frigida TaxID=29902 RepID=UPI003FCC263E